jgi:hypothetical protein
MSETMQAAAFTAAAPFDDSYRKYVNPEWVRLLSVLGMNLRYRTCLGAELHAEDGRMILDFLSGYCVHNTGHNHPRIVSALVEELTRSGPAMLQSNVAENAGTLVAKLTSRVGGELEKVFFCSSGSEGVESAIKFARAHTRRNGIVYAHERSITSRRIGLRQHFQVEPWSKMVEVYWCERSQAYVTPVAKNEICIAIIARLRPESFSIELQQFPHLIERLGAAVPRDKVLGSATMHVKVRWVARGNIALIGDASGTVDALTGEGLALCFRQAQALAQTMRSGDLTAYRRAHVEICRLPRFMSSSLLLLDRSRVLRSRALRAFALRPEIFAAMLRIHVGEKMPSIWGRDGILSLGASVLLA